MAVADPLRERELHQSKGAKAFLFLFFVASQIKALKAMATTVLSRA
jgi:hypothetical protein